MLSFNSLYNHCLDLGPSTRTGATTEVNYSTLFKTLINETDGIIHAELPLSYLEDTSDLTSADGTESYELPVDCKRNQVTSVRYAASSTNFYYPKPVYSATFWEYLQSLNTAESDAPQYYYVYDDKLFLYPIPASNSLTIRVRHKKIHRNMTQDDYTTGGILTATNASTAIVGDTTPTVWTATMAGNYFRITKSASTGTGDGYWYEISSVTDGTNLILVKNYEGTSITSGSAGYTIGEMSQIPGSHHHLLYYRPLAIYFMNKDQAQSDRYWRMYDGGYEAGLAPRRGGGLANLLEAYSGTTEGVWMEEQVPHERSLKDLSITDDVDGESW